MNVWNKVLASALAGALALTLAACSPSDLPALPPSGTITPPATNLPAPPSTTLPPAVSDEVGLPDSSVDGIFEVLNAPRPRRYGCKQYTNDAELAAIAANMLDLLTSDKATWSDDGSTVTVTRVDFDAVLGKAGDDYYNNRSCPLRIWFLSQWEWLSDYNKEEHISFKKAELTYNAPEDAGTVYAFSCSMFRYDPKCTIKIGVATKEYNGETLALTFILGSI